MVDLDTSRVEKTRRWKIPDKFINKEFAIFILNVNDLLVNEISFENIVGYANNFRLQELHGIDLDDILKLFRDKGCAKIFKKDNYIQYHHQNLLYLEAEIRARIEGE